MLYVVSAVHVLLCVFMMFVILLQPGKDAGMGAAFGGGAATSAFGGRGAVTFLSKVTAVCAIAYFITSLGLSFVGLRRTVTAEDMDEPAPAAAAGSTATPTDAKKDTAAPGEANAPAPSTVGEPSNEPSKPLPPATNKATEGTEGVPAEKLPPAKP